MSRLRYYGDPEEFLLALAACVRKIPELGLHVGIGLERVVEDLLATDRVHELEIRDLARQLEDQP